MSEFDCIIQIVGGLGNQMFQYALGRRLQIDRHARVRFDLSMYRVKSDRDLTITRLRTRVPEASKWDEATMRLSFGRTLGRSASLLKHFTRRVLWEIHNDPRSGFDPRVLELHGRSYLRGWWHAPAYFENLRPLLLEEFQPAETLNQSDRELKKQINDVNGICLHVRRGDLVTHPLYSKQLKVQSADYYNNCIAEMVDRVENPHFFVFSDGPAWTRENIRGDAPITFMDHHDGRTDYIDLHLMSHCQHFITANSTFSWWAAWLGQNPGKIVIVPPVWGYDGSGPPPGLIPSSWQIGLMPQPHAIAGATG